MSLTLTVLAGSSTSLRDDLVRCLVLRRPRLVAVVYDVDLGPSGVQLVRRILDATGTAHSEHSEHVELVGCCLSCTTRHDLPEAMRLVADSGRWSEGVLALPAALEPDAVKTHTADVVVDTVTTVVDAVLLLDQVGGDDLLADRGLAAAPADRRSTAELVSRQLEGADVLALVGLERVGTDRARTLQALLAHLAPLALQVPVGPGEQAVTSWSAPGVVTRTAPQVSGSGWLPSRWSCARRPAG